MRAPLLTLALAGCSFSASAAGGDDGPDAGGDARPPGIDACVSFVRHRAGARRRRQLADRDRWRPRGQQPDTDGRERHGRAGRRWGRGGGGGVGFVRVVSPDAELGSLVSPNPS